ncbi:MAG: response regulator, partial [Anaerolineae bacterium]|nr:response regulator [Anaerolineae bacterium]
MTKESILIIEDEQMLVNNMAEKLRAEGYNVSIAMDGETGWDKVRAEKPDLVVLDIMLPGLDG